MSDAVRRGLRTFLWGLVAMTGAVPSLAAVFEVPAGRVAQITAVFTATTAVVTAVINSAEDSGMVPALLKAPASSGDHPVPPV